MSRFVAFTRSQSRHLGLKERTKDHLAGNEAGRIKASKPLISDSHDRLISSRGTRVCSRYNLDLGALRFERVHQLRLRSMQDQVMPRSR